MPAVYHLEAGDESQWRSRLAIGAPKLQSIVLQLEPARASVDKDR
jgi:hypothetical protein